MKVGQFSDTFLPVVDGVGRVVSHYAEGMCHLVEACYVVTPRQSHSGAGNPGYVVVEYPAVAFPGQPQYRVGIPRLSLGYSRRVGNIPFDIVHAHNPFFAGGEALRISRRLGIPLVGTFHSKYYDDIRGFTKSDTLARLGAKVVAGFYSRCDEVWTVSHSAGEVLGSYGYQGPIRIMPNGTDLKNPDPEQMRLVRDRYGLGGCPTLLYVGQLNWKKNIRRILESADGLARQGRDFHLVMTGQGPSEGEIRALSKSLGLEDKVIFTGHISDVRELDALYATADLFVFPSLYDTSGIVVSEAAALGTPALLAAGSSAAEVVRHGVNGLLAQDETQAMVEQIAWALDHPQTLRQIGQAARETIPQPWSKVVAAVLQRYGELIGFKGN